MAKTLRDLVSSNPPLRVDEEMEIHSMLPGRDDPSSHPLEQMFPTGSLNVNPTEMFRRREAGEVTEEQFVTYMDFADPDWRGRRPMSEPVPDEGGVMRPYEPSLSVSGDDEIVSALSFDATVVRRDG